MQREGATFEEIGAAIGVSKQAAKNIFELAMKKLRRHIRLHPEKADMLWNFLEGSPDPKGYGKYKEIE